MGISGSDHALMYAQAGVARFGATRFGYHSAKVFVEVGGLQRANGKLVASYKLDNLLISANDSSTPNKASFDAEGWVPTEGMEVIVTLGSANKSRRLFGGTILSVRSFSVGLIPKFHVECVDWNWLLDDSTVYGHYTGTFDEIALELMADYAPTGFTVRQVESGLATVPGGITFTGVKLSVALKRLAKRSAIPITQKIDERKDLYFRVTRSMAWTNPVDIVEGIGSLRTFNVSRDLSQVANRVPFEGGGSNALTQVAIGETIIPLTDAPAWWYGDVGGVVLSGPQRVEYTARVEGGGGSLVGPGASPSSAPMLALASGAGVDDGAHDVAVVFKTAAGLSLPGPRATITVGSVSAPSVGPTANAPGYGTGPDAGNHYYAMTNITAAGETTPSPVSGTIATIAGIADPTTAPNGPTQEAASGLDITIGAVYAYKYTYVDVGGRETLASSATGTQTVSASGRLRIEIPYSANAAVDRIHVYRSANGGGAPWKLVETTVPNGGVPVAYIVNDPLLALAVRDNITAFEGAAEPTVNGTDIRTVLLTGLQVPSDPLVTSKSIYGTAAGGSQLKFIANLATATTSYSVMMPDASLGSNAPTTNTAAASQIGISAAPIGAAAVTEREFYMTAADDPGGTMRLALTIADNVTTVGTISMSDATLAGQAAAPSVDTSGLSQPSGQVNPGATSVLVAGTAPFRSAGGWAFTGTQAFRYSSFSGSSLAGVPASGPGSIQQTLPYNSLIAAAPCLTGVPASGAGSIRVTIQKGDAVNLCVIAEDTVAQADLQDLLGADAPVVRECPPLQDRRVNRDEALARAQAFLARRAYASVRLGPYVSKDVNNRVGTDVDISVVEPIPFEGVLRVQSVTISNFTPNIMPDYTVQASDEFFSIEDLLSREQ